MYLYSTQQKETYNYKRLLSSPFSGHYDEVGAGGREADVEEDEVSNENHSHRSNESEEEHEYEDAEGAYDWYQLNIYLANAKQQN